MDSQEYINNWSNILKNTNNGADMIATRTAESLKNEGYTAREASDIMVADDFDSELVEAVIDKTYADPTTADNETEKVVVSYVVPTCYEDVKPFVEKALNESSARDFMKKLARTNCPIIPNLPENKLESFVRLAQRAKEDRNNLEVLHNDLLPFIESAMYNSIIIAEKNNTSSVKASDQNHKYVVASKKETYDVQVNEGTCTCEKYSEGNFATFGLACEHIVAVANVISPNYKVARNELG